MYLFCRERWKSFSLFISLILSVVFLEMIMTLLEPSYYVQPIGYKRQTQHLAIASDQRRLHQLNGTKYQEAVGSIGEGLQADNSSSRILRTSEEITYSDKTVVEVIRNIYGVHNNHSHSTTIRVGFFEGFRKFWTYSLIFKPPPSPRTCECGAFRADVRLEKNPAKTGQFELLFIPQDVGFIHLTNRVWNTILSSASSSQKRIYATFEGANKLKLLTLDPPFREKVFHWSWTHHSQSDFPMPYGFYLANKTARPTGEKMRGKNWSENKTALVAWMSTWAVTSWQREKFAKDLRRYLPLNFFGQKYRKCRRNSKECEQTIRKYKFYLALENSCCSEYITEKFWRTLAWDIVPVVFGAPRKDYERLAPPNSFIHADDFDSIEDLANYIKFLDKNDDEYNKYFRWKEDGGEVIINYPRLENKPVDHHIPPANFFYSCSAVCRVGKRYLDEDTNSDVGLNASQNSFFDPNVNWWCGSCTQCGNHQWIRTYN
ncbi:4-galactosyl-N-acetylglucosaminide 3-alpha-L-fucosyltransferase FUT5-like isoform X1 [Apostichopus japonicus]|uniref:4-galactosyl-N-acetylglucosaminide 3-alpha-L-fucosyltransferase FUT5-like isoform X1 n=1 Tax=Stichopus japonicus TaxID=307972 RepID=UPI003AB4E39D